MSILKIMHKPTRVHITKLAQKNCILRYGEDLSSLMFESVRNLETQNTQKPAKTVWQRFVDKFRNTKEFVINISSDDKSNFFVNSNLKIGKYMFVSPKQPFDFEKTLYTLKDFKETVNRTKDDILQKLTHFNKLKHKFGMQVFKKY